MTHLDIEQKSDTSAPSVGGSENAFERMASHLQFILALLAKQHRTIVFL